MNRDSLTISTNQDGYDFLEEKICLNAFHSSEALKNEIGNIILNRSRLNWDFVHIKSRGPFIYLIFKPKIS